MLKTPPLQTATATIDTLCGRLQSATLLEDRRAAILGLRSFAKQYPASVASGSLRELITTLRRDGLGESTNGKDKDADANGIEEGGDVDTIRLVMETLLMLFNPDSNSPEAGDEIAFFLADEFSMRQDNISLLLNLLDSTSPYADYYSRLYSVQILTAVCAARPDRLQECVLNAPLGTSRVVGVLDDSRDAVRNAGLLLLVDLTSGANEDLRKIVAFEDVFGKVFALIRMEGGLADAGIAGQDCLSLLANLIQGSASNQTMFRESGCVGNFANLLHEVFPPEVLEARFVAESREKAGWGVLQLLRLFLVRGESSTPHNQAAFFRAGAAQALLDMSFHPGLPVPIRVAALKSTADLIANNPPIQEQFAALQIAIPSDNETTSQAGSQTNGSRSNTTSARNSARPSVEKARAYVIEALLNLTLDQPRGEASLRAAACALIQAYLGKHDRIKNHFLQRAISGYHQGEEAANILTSLLQPGTDPLGVLFASWIVQDLFAGVSDAKQILAAVKEGNESEGEEVLTSVQALGSQLETAMQTGADEKVIASYASTLIVFLWDFAEGVDDLLAEGSGLIQALVASVSSAATAPLTAGLAASLLGTIYEFSTKDSPISRRTLAPLLTQKLGRGKYLGALLALRRDPVIRDFGIEEPQGDSDFVNETFVDLFQTEYTRLRKAIDKDPGMEVLPFDDAAAGVDRDVLDDLRQQLQTMKDALTQSEQAAQQSGQQAQNEKLALQKDMQSAKSELDRLRKINDAMQRGHEEETTKMKSQHQREKEALNVEHSRTIASARQEADRQARQAHQQQEQGFAGRVQEYERRLAELGNAHRTEQTGHNTLKQQIETLRKQHSELTAREQGAARHIQDVTKAHEELGRAHKDLQTRSSQAETELEQLRKQLSERDVQIESLEGKLKDLQDNLAGKEQELATERAGFADLEKELESAKATSEAKAASDKETAGRIETLEKELESAKETSEAKAASDKETASRIQALEKELETAQETSKAKAASDKKTAGKIEALEKELELAKATSEAKAASGKETAGKIEALEKELESTKAVSEAKRAGDSETSEKVEKLETLSKSLAGKVKELQEEVKTSKQAKDATDLKLKEIEKKHSDAVAKAAQNVKDAEKKAKDAADKSLKEAEKKAKDAAEEGLKEAEKKVQDAEKRAKDAVEKAKKASEESGNAANKKKGVQQASKKEADEAAKAAEAAKKEVEAAKKDAAAAKEEVAAAKAAADAAKKAADAATAAEKEAREELESLVLVIEDIEKKRDEYKDKVRELGGEVSEDDEDSDDEDEDDDEGDVTLD
ncbi:hypothetical protein Q7P35_005380 [Cladosporium inversicolor]